MNRETLELGGDASAAGRLRRLVADGLLFAPFTHRPPSWDPVNTVFVYTTNACNLDCPYCYREMNTQKLSFECARRTVDRSAAEVARSGKPRIVNVRFIGGEPLMNLRSSSTSAATTARGPATTASSTGTRSSPTARC